jgi:hypothetical protein
MVKRAQGMNSLSELPVVPTTGLSHEVTVTFAGATAGWRLKGDGNVYASEAGNGCGWRLCNLFINEYFYEYTYRIIAGGITY